MKLYTKNKQLESNMDVQDSVDFGIDKENEAVIIDILRNKLYSHKIRTLVQEYMSNARDANREIGQTKKIEVHVPSSQYPNFYVRDYGPGLTPDRIAKVFAKYGSSTKRNTNTQTGGFGIGAKSAWSYTDSFMIDSWVDGIRYSYIAQIADNNLGRMDKISEENSSEPNGVRVTIGVKQADVDEFIKSIQRACIFWDEEEFPEFVNHGPFFIKDLQLREKASERFYGLGFNANAHHFSHLTPIGSHGIIVCDGIPFENNTECKPLSIFKENSKANSVIFVPNGLITVSASRENIETTKENEKVVQQILANVDKSYVETQSEINKMTDIEYAKIGKTQSVAGVKFSYRGEFISGNTIMNGYGNPNIQDSRIHTLGSSYQKAINYAVNLGISGLKNAFYIDRSDDFISSAKIGRLKSHLRSDVIIIKIDLYQTVIKQSSKDEDDDDLDDLGGLSKALQDQKVEKVRDQEKYARFIELIEFFGAKPFKDVYAQIPKASSGPRAKSARRDGYAFTLNGFTKSSRISELSEDLLENKIILFYYEIPGYFYDFARRKGLNYATTKTKTAFEKLSLEEDIFISFEKWLDECYQPDEKDIASHLWRVIPGQMLTIDMKTVGDVYNAIRFSTTPIQIKSANEKFEKYRERYWSVSKNLPSAVYDKLKQLDKTWLSDYNDFRREAEEIVKKIPLINAILTNNVNEDCIDDFVNYINSKFENS